MHRAPAAYLPAQNDDGALIARHGPLIDRVARRVAYRSGGAVSPDDLWSAGALGLLEAVRRFDSTRDVKFETFAEYRIRGAMLDELRRMDHLPRRLRANVDRVSKERKKLSHALGRESTTGEVADSLGMDLEEVGAIEQLNQPPMPLPDAAPFASSEPGPEEAFARRQRIGRVSAAVAKLPERLQTLLSLHYVEGMTYREIAEVMEVSEPRICQLHAEAVAKLRGQLEENLG